MHVQTLSYRPDPGVDADAALTPLRADAHLVLAFGSYRLAARAPRALKALYRRWPDALILGCSTAGEIHGPQISDDSLCVAAIRLERATARRASARLHGSPSSYETGRQVAEQLSAPDLRCVLLLSAGLGVDQSALVAALRDHLAPGVVLSGGFAADHAEFRDTWVLEDGGPVADAVTAVGLYGQHLAMRHGCDNGMAVFSGERVVTRSSQNILYELDGLPALDVYKSYLGPFAGDLPGSGLLFPFSVRAHAGADRSLIRSVIGIDEQERSMTLIGDAPEGSLVRLMSANLDQVVAAARRAADSARFTEPVMGDCLALVVSCVGRRLVLGDRTEDETEAAMAHLPPGVHSIGFYSFGEIAPHVSSVCDLHNQTLTVTLLAETA